MMTPVVLDHLRPSPLSRSRKAVLLAAAVWTFCTPVAAQAPSATPKPEMPSASSVVAPLTVTGAAEPKVIQKQTWSFVEAYAAAAPKLDLIGRWREPICVQAVNLTPEQAALVKARVEAVARGVGLQIRKPGCQSNIQIVLTSQPQAFMDSVAKADEHALGFHYPSDLQKVKTVTHPIQGWYKTATQSAHFGHDGLPFAVLGMRPGVEPNPADPTSTTPNPGSLVGETHAAETVDTVENGSPPGCAGSLIGHCERSVFKNVLVVIDSRALEGKDLGAVADYVAMLALSHVKSADGCSALPSILDLLAKSPCADRDPPDELTPADASYLTALYASNPESTAASMRVEMAGRMADILVKANKVASSTRTGADVGGKR